MTRFSSPTDRLQFLEAAVADRSLSHTAVRVLAALVFCTNDKTGECFPGTDTIAGMAGLSGRHPVINARRELQSAGWIRLAVQGTAGRGSSNHYILVLEKGAPHAPLDDPDTVEKGARKGARRAPEPRTSHACGVGEEEDALTRGARPDGRAAAEDEDNVFEAFWTTYPKQFDKPATFTAWLKQLANGTDPAAIIRGAANYAADWRANVAHRRPGGEMRPATWLSQGEWRKYQHPPKQTRRRKVTDPLDDILHAFEEAASAGDETWSQE